MAFYYMNGFNFNENKTIVESLKGYMTNIQHDMFLPPKLFTKQEIIKLIKTGNTVFIQDGCYNKICIKIYEINGVDYLRVDNHSNPVDYFG